MDKVKLPPWGSKKSWTWHCSRSNRPGCTEGTGTKPPREKRCAVCREALIIKAGYWYAVRTDLAEQVADGRHRPQRTYRECAGRFDSYLKAQRAANKAHRSEKFPFTPVWAS